MDTLISQIQRCWQIDKESPKARQLPVQILVEMNLDGTVQKAKILDYESHASDPVFRTAAESALKAVLNPHCQPFKLPPEKYQRWKEMQLTFDPREMLGL